jgi:sulfur carrier protein
MPGNSRSGPVFTLLTNAGNSRILPFHILDRASLNLILNGIDRDVAGVSDVAGLLERLGLSGARLVVERNGEIVTRDAFAATALRERDRIEIVRLVGGG